MKKLATIYRICKKECDGNFNPTRPGWFDKKKCWKSYWDQFGPFSDTYVVWDGEIDKGVGDYIQSFPIKEFINIQEGTDRGSLIACYNLADKLKGDYEWYYLSEDDYIFASNAYKIFLEGAEVFPLFTLYNHLDRYIRDDDVSWGQEYIFLTKSTHWRTAESTTNTTIIRADLFDKLKNIMIECAPNDRKFYRSIINQIRLVTPIPGNATHVNVLYWNPLVDWEKVNSEIVL